MIDLHAHILPGLDDGAADLDEALAMADLALADGITTVVATPHHDAAEPDLPALALAGWTAFRRALLARGLALDVLLGFELLLTPALAALGARARDLGLNASRYLLVELPPGPVPPYLLDTIFRLQGHGLRPILAHAERYPAVADLAADLVGRGLLLQINGDSLLGTHGREVRRRTERLVAAGQAHFLCSDTHSPRRRAPRLAEAAAAASRLVGPAAADALVHANPAAVLADIDLPPMPPIRRRFARFAFRRPAALAATGGT